MIIWKAQAESVEGQEIAKKANHVLGGYDGFKTKKACQEAIESVTAFCMVPATDAVPVKIKSV